MPSASAKLEKQTSQEVTDPFKQVLTLIDHKRRNLEKRKAKLDGYRTEQKNGKELKGEQLAAVAKYDEVCKTLEFAMDMSKSVLSLSADHAKVQKKQQRKEQLEKTQNDLSRIRELLIVQDVMHNMGNETVRADFLAGRDGAISVTQEELTRLDELYPLLSPKREDGTAFAQQVASAAEHLLSLMEGRSKELLGSTYASVRELLQRINVCGYFEQNAQKLVPEFVTQEGNCTDEGTDTPLVDPAIIEKEEAAPLPLPPQVLPPVMAAQPVEPPQQPIVAAVPVAAVPVVAEAASYFSAPVVAPVPTAAPPPQFPPLPQQAMQTVPVQLRQQHRPIAEVIGQTTSSFNFLQESQLEMESPSPPNVDLAVMLQFPPTGLPPGRNPPAAPAASAVPQPDFHQTIPTQTFTNQSFSVIPQQGAVPVTAPSTTTPASAAPHIPTFTQQPTATATPPFIPNVEPPPPIPMPPRVMQEDQGKMIAPQSAGAPPPSFAQAATYSSQAQGAKPQNFVSGAPPGFTPQQKVQHVPQQAPQHMQPPLQLQQTSSNQHQQVQQQTSQFQPIPSLEQAAELDRADEQASWTDAGIMADGDEFSSGGRAGGYRGRGGRGRGRGGTNGYSGRSRGQQNGGGGRSGGYQGRNPQEGSERSYENGLTSQRDYSSNFKRSGAPPRDRDGPRDGPPRDRDGPRDGPPRDREGAPSRGSQAYRGGSGAPFRGSANNRNNMRGGGSSGNQGGPRAQHVKQ